MDDCEPQVKAVQYLLCARRSICWVKRARKENHLSCIGNKRSRMRSLILCIRASALMVGWKRCVFNTLFDIPYCFALVCAVAVGEQANGSLSFMTLEGLLVFLSTSMQCVTITTVASKTICGALWGPPLPTYLLFFQHYLPRFLNPTSTRQHVVPKYYSVLPCLGQGVR